MEAVNYSDSPLADYLKEAGEVEDTVQDDERPSYPLPSSDARPTATTPDGDGTPSGPYPDLLKYTLASSGLLNPNLQDALLGYPEPSPVAPPKSKSTTPFSTTTTRTTTGSSITWPEGWESYGSTRSLLSRLVQKLPRPSSLHLFSPDSPEPPSANQPFLSIGLGIGLPLPNSNGTTELVPSTEVKEKKLARLLKETEEFVRACQEFDLRVVRGMEEKAVLGDLVGRVLREMTKEVEDAEVRGKEVVRISWGEKVASSWGSPSEDTTQGGSNEPLSPSPFSTPRPRTTLPPPPPQSRPRPSSLFLPRQSSPTRKPRPASMIQTNGDTIFGGIDRAALGSPKSASSTNRFRHGVGGSSTSEAVDFWKNLASSPDREVASFNSNNDDFEGIMEKDGGDVLLQQSFDELHKIRGRFLWSLVGLFDSPLPKRTSIEPWTPIIDLLSSLTSSFQKKSREMRLGLEKGHAKSGSVVALESELGGLGRKASWRRRSVQGTTTTTAHGGRTSRPTSLFLPSSPTNSSHPFNNNNFRHHHKSSLSQSLPPSYSATSTRSNSRNRRPPSSSFFPPSTTTTTTTTTTTNFAPPHPSSTTSTLYQFNKANENILLTLRTIISKISLVEEDVLSRGRNGGGSAEGGGGGEERILSTHDSIRGDLERLGMEWDEGRVRLRGVLREVGASEVVGREEEEEEEGEEEVPERANSSLDSIPDVGEDLIYRDAQGEVGDAFFSTGEDSHHQHHQSTSSITSSFLEELQAEEEVFEAVSGGGDKRGKANLSREERIRLIKEEREVGLGAGVGKAERKTLNMEVGMVEELKDVLSLLKSRKKLGSEI